MANCQGKKGDEESQPQVGVTGGWMVPAPLDTVEVRMADGAPIVLRRHGNPDGPRLVVSHGCGLASDALYPFWALLADRFDLVVHDFRNHGWNPVGNRRAHNFATFVRDNEDIVRAIDAHFGEKRKIGVFHSMSALTALVQSMKGKRRHGYSALVLFDLPVCPPGGDPKDMVTVGRRIGMAARWRQDRFETRQEFAETIRRSPLFERLLPGVADLFARTVLRRTADGTGYELCCPRDYEAQVHEYAFGWSIDLDTAEPPCPVKAIGADPTMSHTFMPGVDLGGFCGLDYDFVPETTHFLQVEKPKDCVELMIEFLELHGLA